MQRSLLALALLFVLPVAAAHAQATILPGGSAPAQPTKPATTTTTEASPTAIAPPPMAAAADPTAIKVKAEINPATGKLTVRTDNPGPTRVEVNDVSGRPLLTHTMMVGTTPAALDVKQLSPGSYVVRCTAGDRTGMRRVTIE
jgi:glucose/arabinose dehydrogenase